MQIIRQRRSTAPANANGVAWVDCPQHARAVSAGGFATVDSGGVCGGGCAFSDPDTTDPIDAVSFFPIVATMAELQPGNQIRYRIGFGAPPGATLCVHVYTVVDA